VHVEIKVVPDFSSGKSAIQPFSGNPAKSSSEQIDANAAAVLSVIYGVFAILISATVTTKYIYHRSTNFVKNQQAVT